MEDKKDRRSVVEFTTLEELVKKGGCTEVYLCMACPTMTHRQIVIDMHYAHHLKREKRKETRSKQTKHDPKVQDMKKKQVPYPIKMTLTTHLIYIELFNFILLISLNNGRLCIL